MKRALSLLAALAFGCDDTEVSDTIASLLAHGAVSAQARCEFVAATTVDTGNPGDIGCTIDTALDIQMYADGSASVNVVQSDRDVGAARIIPRSHADADDLHTVFGGCSCESKISMFVDGGDLKLKLFDKQGSCPDVPSPQTFASLDIETECTGFNLEAFGVTP